MKPDLDLLELDHRARSRGLPPALAATVARVAGSAEALLAEFGDPAETTALVADAARIPRSAESTLPAIRRFPVVPLIVREIRFASRRLIKSPGFSAIAIGTLALGIGAMTSIFSVINAVVLRPWPIVGVEEVYDLFEQVGGAIQPLTNPDLRDLERGTKDVFVAVAGIRYARAQAGEGAETAPVAVELVTGSYFGIVGLPPALGRLLGPEDDVAPGGHPVVVLGHRYWERNFHADPGVVGQTIRLNGRPYSIVGVAAAAYQGNVRALRPDLTASMMMVNILSPSETDLLESREAHGMFGKARVRPAVTEAGARGAADRVATDLRTQRVGSWRAETTSFRLIPTKSTILFPDADPYLRRLRIAAGRGRGVRSGSGAPGRRIRRGDLPDGAARVGAGGWPGGLASGPARRQSGSGDGASVRRVTRVFPTESSPPLIPDRPRPGGPLPPPWRRRS